MPHSFQTSVTIYKYILPTHNQQQPQQTTAAQPALHCLSSPPTSVNQQPCLPQGSLNRHQLVKQTPHSKWPPSAQCPLWSSAPRSCLLAPAHHRTALCLLFPRTAKCSNELFLTPDNLSTKRFNYIAEHAGHDSSPCCYLATTAATRLRRTGSPNRRRVYIAGWQPRKGSTRLEVVGCSWNCSTAACHMNPDPEHHNLTNQSLPPTSHHLVGPRRAGSTGMMHLRYRTSHHTNYKPTPSNFGQPFRTPCTTTFTTSF